MKVLNNLTEVAAELSVGVERVQREFKEGLVNMFMEIKESTIMIEFGKDNLEYVLVDINSDKDCREYFLKYEVDRVDWEVYTDEIVGFEKCKVINVENDKWDIIRATVITETGTQLNRIVKTVISKQDEDYKEDGCIYFFKK